MSHLSRCTLSRRLRPSPFGLEKKLIRAVGTRGVCLLLLGTLWVILGLLFTIHPMERFSRVGPGGVLDFLDRNPGPLILGSLWIVGGSLAILTAFQRPITCKDDLGFNGIALPPFFWAAGYWWSFIINTFSDGRYGRSNVYLAAFLYSILVILPMFLSRHLSDHPEGPCARRRAILDGRIPQ